MADFWAGVAQGFSPGMQLGLRGAEMRANREDAQRKQALAAQQQASEFLGKAGEVIARAPEEQRGIMTKNMLSAYATMRGIQIPKEVMSFFNSNPAGMTAMLINQQGTQGMTLDQMDKALGDPLAFITLVDSYNQGIERANARKAVQAGTSGTDIAAVQAAQGTPGLGREQLGALQNRAEMLQRQGEFNITNELERTARQMGFPGYADLPATSKQIVQNQVFANVGRSEQAKATGSAMGGLVAPSTAADTGISPFSTVSEARQATGMAGAGGGPAVLPTTAQVEDAKIIREQTGLRKKDYRTATVSAEKMDPQLDMLGSLLEQGLKTGVTAPLELRIKKLAGELTGKDFADVDKASLFNQVADSMSFSFLQQIGGNDSNQDREYARSIIASLGNTPNANKAMIDFMKIANERVRAREVQHDKFVKVCGADGRNCKGDFSEYWEAWKNAPQNSLKEKYDGVLKKYALATGAPAANQVAAPTSTPRGGGASVADFSAPPPQMPGLPTTLPNATLPMPQTQGGAAYVSPRGIRPKF